MKLIKILQFADVINRYDFIDTLVQYADPTRFEMSVCVRTEEHNIARPLFAENIKYKLLPGNSRRDLLQTAWKLSKILREWEIDILHTHHFDQAIIGWLATKVYPKTKLIVGRHYSDSLYRLGKSFKSNLLLKLEQVINHKAVRIIVPSQFIFEILTERQKIDTKKIDVVLYGFVPEKYSAPGLEEIENVQREFTMADKFTIANFSRLHEEKGQRYLIEAAALLKNKIPNLLVLIVGEGVERESLENQISRLNLRDVVKLTGWRRDAMTIMAAADVVVQSTLQEAFSQVMVETLWMSKPLIITDVSGAPDIIENEENGILVPKANSDDLADAIKKIYVDRTLLNKISSNGRKFVEEHLYIEKMIKQYENSFLKAVDL